jgi:GNAT superfamily N-acetyltransferase
MSADAYGLEIRIGVPEDEAVLLAFFDEADDWLVARGQTGQWGDQPISADAESVQQVRRFCNGGGLRIAEHGGAPVGALVIGVAPDYVPPANQAESYIHLLLTSRRSAGNGIGARLIEQAVDEARRDGCSQLRVDCWAGAPSLLAWYQRNGFRPTGTFELKGWPGQVFTKPVAKHQADG